MTSVFQKHARGISVKMIYVRASNNIFLHNNLPMGGGVGGGAGGVVVVSPENQLVSEKRYCSSSKVWS